MCTNCSGSGVVEHRRCNCFPRCNGDVVVSSLDVDSLLDVPLLSSCDDCCDVAVAAAAAM